MAASDAIRGRAWVPVLRRLGPALLVVALLACVLVPLPTGLVDLLLSLSLSAAVVMLVAALGIRRPTDFFRFPQLLLLATLFRLALNLSTTRLILSQADAGKVVDAFAGIVVRGDMIVGGVMFLIITVVQFVVIAQGSERVAEVAARFALDGLPGHQAAIDADLRAGALSARQAAERRADLTDRSNFFGAMDGTIRFVRGDAVAGLIITGVNLVGGLAIGMIRMGYGWQESLGVYGRLTIGDGLLAQIPALLVSLAAGILVSRVDRSASERTPPWLEPPMLFVPAGLLAVLATVPAMPGLAFATTAVGLVTAGVFMQGGRRREPAIARPELRLVLATPARAFRDRRAGLQIVEEVRRRCEAALGIAVPAIDVELGTSSAQMVLRYGRRTLGRRELQAEDTVDAVILFTFRSVMEHADRLVDLERVDRMVEDARSTHPAVVRTALTIVELPTLLAVMRGFLRERIPVPPMVELLGAIVELPEIEAVPRLVERVRERMAPQWLPEVLDGIGPTAVWSRPTPDTEQYVLDRFGSSHGDLEAVVGPARDRLSTALLGEPRAKVVLVTPRARRAVAQLLRGAPPHAYVVSTAELLAAGASAPVPTRWVEFDDDGDA